MNPAELTAELHLLRELAPAFAVRTLRWSIERAAKAAMELRRRPRRANSRNSCSRKAARFASIADPAPTSLAGTYACSVIVSLRRVASSSSIASFAEPIAAIATCM